MTSSIWATATAAVQTAYNSAKVIAQVVTNTGATHVLNPSGVEILHRIQAALATIREKKYAGDEKTDEYFHLAHAALELLQTENNIAFWKNQQHLKETKEKFNKLINIEIDHPKLYDAARAALLIFSELKPARDVAPNMLALSSMQIIFNGILSDVYGTQHLSQQLLMQKLYRYLSAQTERYKKQAEELYKCIQLPVKGTAFFYKLPATEIQEKYKSYVSDLVKEIDRMPYLALSVKQNSSIAYEDLRFDLIAAAFNMEKTLNETYQGELLFDSVYVYYKAIYWDEARESLKDELITTIKCLQDVCRQQQKSGVFDALREQIDENMVLIHEDINRYVRRMFSAVLCAAAAHRAACEKSKISLNEEISNIDEAIVKILHYILKQDTSNDSRMKRVLANAEAMIKECQLIDDVSYTLSMRRA